MPRSRFRGGSFATIAVAVAASVVVLAAVAAWERASVSVYEPTPTESLLLLKAGEVVDPSVPLGASQFEERVEKRIEGFDRGVLEYVFAAEDTGVEVRSRIVERHDADLARAEVARLEQEFGGDAVDPFAGSLFSYPANEEGVQVPQVWRKNDRFLFVATTGTYVYAVEMSADFSSEVDVAQSMWSKMRELDRPGAVLPLRAPRVATER